MKYVKITSLSNHPNGDCSVDVSECSFKYNKVFTGSLESCKKIYFAFAQIGYFPENFSNRIDGTKEIESKNLLHSFYSTGKVINFLNEHPEVLKDLIRKIELESDEDDNEQIIE